MKQKKGGGFSVRQLSSFNGMPLCEMVHCHWPSAMPHRTRIPAIWEDPTKQESHRFDWEIEQERDECIINWSISIAVGKKCERIFQNHWGEGLGWDEPPTNSLITHAHYWESEKSKMPFQLFLVPIKVAGWTLTINSSQRNGVVVTEQGIDSQQQSLLEVLSTILIDDDPNCQYHRALGRTGGASTVWQTGDGK